MDDLVSIGEFSARSGISARRLRGWAAAGVLIPAAVDSASGYRWYAPGQLRDAALVDALRTAGMPIAEIGAFLRRPAVNRLDDWARRLEDDAGQRRDALHQARRLLLPETLDHPEESMRFRTAARSETGHVRETNEDAVATGAALAVVADGMGGGPGGELASSLAVAIVSDAFSGRSDDELAAAVRAANRVVWEMSRRDDDLAGMGTTVCAAGLLDDGRLAVVHVGDSRAYLARDGSLGVLTEDHTVPQDLVRRGEISEEDAAHHPLHHILTRALGVGPAVELDRSLHAVVPGDRVLLCSDGLFRDVAPAELTAAVTGGNDLQATADTLVELALAAGGGDNVSVVVAEFA